MNINAFHLKSERFLDTVDLEGFSLANQSIDKLKKKENLIDSRVFKQLVMNTESHLNFEESNNFEMEIVDYSRETTFQDFKGYYEETLKESGRGELMYHSKDTGFE